ncbi:MAG TPA: DUF4126 domain-containing protein, partial [Chloroflexaceae bacterium]|nr:DUF4126 domain-containing protein [Chloroflexaceae bacterium]
ATVSPVLVGLAGIVAAGGTHAARATVRPVVTAATAGTGNTVVSAVEDGASLGLSVLAIILPIIGLIVAAVGAVLVFLGFRRARRVWRDRAATNGRH